MPCAFQFFLSEKFDFCTHVLYRIFEGILCDMRINIQSRTDLGMSHNCLNCLVIGLDFKHPSTKRMPQTMNGKVWKQ